MVGSYFKYTYTAIFTLQYTMAYIVLNIMYVTAAL